MSTSFLATTTTTTPATTTIPGRSSRVPRSIPKRVSYTSCKHNQHEGSDSTPNYDLGGAVDRRNVLLGLGGLCGTAGTFGKKAVGATPVAPPDLSKCQLATDVELPPGQNRVPCCPPYGSLPIQDWRPPSLSEPLRVRQPAHKLDSQNLAKFKEAIARMKALPKDHPWNYMQQAQIHCAYCNDAYDQVGFEGVPLQVHGSFLFAAWHRYYLYFWERILGKLINDPTFAIPFWNWDTPKGMGWPLPYLDPSSPLYNDNRNKDHYSMFLDLKWTYGAPERDRNIVTQENLEYLHTMFTESKDYPYLFHGFPVVAGQNPASEAAGGLELIHNVHHSWCGPDTKPYWDMGNFHTTARDTIFWGHHSNVDRLWSIYRTFIGNKVEIGNDSWLNASFIFYNENSQVVKCKVRDSLDTTAMRYIYQTEEIPWLDIRRTSLLKKKAKGLVTLMPVSRFGTKPQPLTSNLRVLIDRPKVSRSKFEKLDAPELITVSDIKFDQTEPARFDVYIDKPIEGFASSDLGEFVGSFVHIPRSRNKNDLGFVLKLGITTVLEDIEAEASDTLVVSLVPRLGEVTVGGVGINLALVDEE